MLTLQSLLLRRGTGVRRHNAEVGGEFLGALQLAFAVVKTGTVKPELIIKGWIALDSLPTAGTFYLLECIAELHAVSSNTPDAGGDAEENGGVEPETCTTGRTSEVAWQALLTRPCHQEERLP